MGTAPYRQSRVVVVFAGRPIIFSLLCLSVIQSRRQSSRLRGAKRLLRGPKFEIKHKSRCLQMSKLVDWGGGGKVCRLGGRPPWLLLGAGPGVT